MGCWKWTTPWRYKVVYNKRWKVIEEDGKKLIRDWGHPIRMDCITCRPIEYISKTMILLIDMKYPDEYSKVAKEDEKI